MTGGSPRVYTGLSGASTHQHLLSHIRRFLWSVINCRAHFQPRCGSPAKPPGPSALPEHKRSIAACSLSLSKVNICGSFSPHIRCFLIAELSWAHDHKPPPISRKQEAAGKWGPLKRVVHPKMNILSLFTHPRVIPNLYDFLFLNTKGNSEECAALKRKQKQH